ncbi:hypothetical protein RKD23_002080 [Streptomyces sp. SAI-170]
MTLCHTGSAGRCRAVAAWLARVAGGARAWLGRASVRSCRVGCDQGQRDRAGARLRRHSVRSCAPDRGHRERDGAGAWLGRPSIWSCLLGRDRNVSAPAKLRRPPIWQWPAAHDQGEPDPATPRHHPTWSSPPTHDQVEPDRALLRRHSARSWLPRRDQRKPGPVHLSGGLPCRPGRTVAAPPTPFGTLTRRRTRPRRTQRRKAAACISRPSPPPTTAVPPPEAPALSWGREQCRVQTARAGARCRPHSAGTGLVHRRPDGTRPEPPVHRLPPARFRRPAPRLNCRPRTRS